MSRLPQALSAQHADLDTIEEALGLAEADIAVLSHRQQSALLADIAELREIRRDVEVRRASLQTLRVRPQFLCGSA